METICNQNCPQWESRGKNNAVCSACEVVPNIEITMVCPTCGQLHTIEEEYYTGQEKCYKDETTLIIVEDKQ